MSLSPSDSDVGPEKINLGKHGLKQQDGDDPNLVTFSEDSKFHPRSRPLARRVFDISIVLLLQLFTTALSTSGTPQGLAAMEEYGLTRTTSILVFVTTFQLGRVCGSTALPPFTESFGRKQTFVVASLVFSVMCLIVGVVPHVAGAIVGRVLSGGMSSAYTCVSAGAIEDMFDTHARIWIMYVWTASAIAGLAFGPIYGSYVTQALGWRWSFYLAAIIMFGGAILCLFMQESRASRVLEHHVRKVRQETGSEELRTDISGSGAPKISDFFKNSIYRPWFLLVTEPIVATVVAMTSIAWSLLFLFTESLTVVYGLQGFSEVQSSLFFIPLIIGIFGGIPVRMRDRSVLDRKFKAEEKVKPEDKLLGFAIGAPAMAIGLWWFTWTIPQAVHTHWIVPSLGLVLVGFAITEFEYVLSGYLTDSYVSHASSAVASISTVRSIFAGTLPLFAYFMFTGISANAASSVLAGVATAFCIAPYIFIKYGVSIRSKSKFASESVESMNKR